METSLVERVVVWEKNSYGDSSCVLKSSYDWRIVFTRLDSGREDRFQSVFGDQSSEWVASKGKPMNSWFRYLPSESASALQPEPWLDWETDLFDWSLGHVHLESIQSTNSKSRSLQTILDDISQCNELQNLAAVKRSKGSKSKPSWKCAFYWPYLVRLDVRIGANFYWPLHLEAYAKLPRWTKRQDHPKTIEFSKPFDQRLVACFINRFRWFTSRSNSLIWALDFFGGQKW